MEHLHPDAINHLAEVMSYELLEKALEAVDGNETWTTVIKAHIKFRYDLRLFIKLPPQLEESGGCNALVAARKSTFRSQGMNYKDWDMLGRSFARLSRCIIEGSELPLEMPVYVIPASSLNWSWRMRRCFKNNRCYPQSLGSLMGMLDVTAGCNKDALWPRYETGYKSSNLVIRCLDKSHESIFLKLLPQISKNFEDILLEEIKNAPELIEKIVQHFSSSLNLTHFEIKECSINDNILIQLADLVLQKRECSMHCPISDHVFSASAVEELITRWKRTDGECSDQNRKSMRLAMTEEQSQLLVANATLLDRGSSNYWNTYIVHHPTMKSSLKINFERYWNRNQDRRRSVVLTIVPFSLKRRHEDNDENEDVSANNNE